MIAEHEKSSVIRIFVSNNYVSILEILKNNKNLIWQPFNNSLLVF